MDDFRKELAALLPQLRIYARSLARNYHLADDLVQDTVVLALQARAQFTPGTSLRAWLFTILRRRFLSVVTRSRPTCSIDEAGGEIDNQLWRRPEQESRIEVAAFKLAFSALDMRHREVLVLVGLHGLSQDEVAAICGCEVGTVKSRLSRARGLLRAMLLDDGPGSSKSSRTRYARPGAGSGKVRPALAGAPR